jgi:hypothetical protein
MLPSEEFYFVSLVTHFTASSHSVLVGNVIDRAPNISITPRGVGADHTILVISVSKFRLLSSSEIRSACCSLKLYD